MHYAAGVCVGPTPTAVRVGRSSAARFLVSGIFAATRHRFTRTDDLMTARTQLRFAHPRHAGDSQFAASWRAPVGAMGTGMQARWMDAGREMRIARPSDRKQSKTEVGSRKTSGYRSLAAGHSGAGSGFRGDAP